MELKNISSKNDDSLGTIKTCSQSGCNHENVQYSHCVSCESDLKGECANISDASALIGKCEGQYPYDRRGCFTLNKGKQIFYYSRTYFTF